MTQLIVNADDFGLTHGVNRAIVELHIQGLLPSATLMARAAATQEAIQLAHQHPSLGVGCHVVLLDGEPILPAERIPALIDPRTGRFYRTLSEFLPRLLSGRVPAPQIQAEASAQLAHLQNQGMKLTHIDAHKHVHSFPAVLRPVLRAAKAAGIHAVRNPFEPDWSLQLSAAAAPARRLTVRLHRLLRKAFLRIAVREGFHSPAGSIGVAATGSLDAALLGRLLKRMPEGCWELVTHPGYNDADLAAAHTKLLQQRVADMAALEALRHCPQTRLISFAQIGES